MHVKMRDRYTPARNCSHKSGLMVGMVLVESTAAAVTMFDRPSRKVFQLALMLPLAIPAYVVAYANNDFLQFGGHLQTRTGN